MSPTNSRVAAFQKTVLGFYKKHGRHELPWRTTRNPYCILVSEIMLQQTQVERVILYYKRFLQKFPTVHALAHAPLSAVLREWQGLGYNRRAKMLHDAAKEIAGKRRGVFPREREALLSLPGVGPYTASAVRVFAFNEPERMIETNIRAAYLHHFFPLRKKVSDKEILAFIHVPKGKARLWYSALMDYGSHLKKLHSNPSRKSAHYIKQKSFKGSDREIRGAILKVLARRAPLNALPFAPSRVQRQLSVLHAEGLIRKKGARYRLGN